MDDLNKLSDVLAEAEREREEELLRLAGMADDEIAYLARVDELEDTLSDGLEAN